MAWQLLVFIGLFASVMEEIIDKNILVRSKLNSDAGAANHPLIGSFYRNLCFWIFVVIAGLFSMPSEIHLYIPWPVIAIGVSWPISSMIYHHFLKTQALSRISSISYIFPFLFILIDQYLFEITFTAWQIIGFIILIAGAILISFEFNAKTLLSLPAKIWALIFVKFLFAAASLGIFKFYADHPEMNEISYYFWKTLFALVTFLLFISLRKELKTMLFVGTHDRFFLHTLTAKFFDFIAAIALLKALTMTSLSEANILGSAYPLVLISSIFVLNRVFKLHLEENFSRVNLAIKITAMLLLTIGSFIIIEQG